MECELCGRNAQLMKTEIEGTVISVCESCSKLGRRTEFTVDIPTKKFSDIDTYAINPDFSKIIKNARTTSGLTLEQLGMKINEKVSVLERVERGMRPTDALARKLEKALKIKLYGSENA